MADIIQPRENKTNCFPRDLTLQCIPFPTPKTMLGSTQMIPELTAPKACTQVFLGFLKWGIYMVSIPSMLATHLTAEK